MLSVLAIAVLIATTGATVPEFKEDYLNKLIYVARDSPVINAEFLNSKVQIKLQTAKVAVEGESAIFIPVETIRNHELTDDVDVCANHNGIALNNRKDIYCDIIIFAMKVNKPKDDVYTSLQFALILGSPNWERGIILDIPVYKIPRGVSTGNKGKLAEWAKKSKVGLTSPVDEQQLQAILQNKPVTLQLEGLKELISYGVRDTLLSNRKMKIHVSRPIVLEESFIDKIVGCVDKLVNQKK